MLVFFPSLEAFGSYSSPNVSTGLWSSSNDAMRLHPQPNTSYFFSRLVCWVLFFFLEFSYFCEDNISVDMCWEKRNSVIVQMVKGKSQVVVPCKSFLWQGLLLGLGCFHCCFFPLPLKLVLSIIYEKLNLDILLGSDKPCLEL